MTGLGKTQCGAVIMKCMGISRCPNKGKHWGYFGNGKYVYYCDEHKGYYDDWK